jgi:hypothetical protein
MNPRSCLKEPEISLKQVLPIAEQMMVRDGLRAVPLMSVAEATGYPAASLSKLFPAPWDLRGAILLRHATARLKRMRDESSRTDDPIEKVRVALQCKLDYTEESPVVVKLFQARSIVSRHFALLAFLFLLPVLPARAVENGVKQPIFLMCPQKAKYSAWSLYLTVDSADHSKVLGLGLDKLVGQNASGSKYAAVLAAQKSGHGKIKNLGVLNACEFGHGELAVKEDDALHVSLTPQSGGSYELMLSMRVGASDRFDIGGKAKGKRSVALQYDPSSGTWHATAEALKDNKGANVAGAAGRTITGILFPVTGTGIYMVACVFDDGDGMVVMDRTW